MHSADRDKVVRLLIEEMKDRVMRATPETRDYETQIVLTFSSMIVALQPELTPISMLPSFP